MPSKHPLLAFQRLSLSEQRPLKYLQVVPKSDLGQYEKKIIWVATLYNLSTLLLTNTSLTAS